jgi:hypothetical protein
MKKRPWIPIAVVLLVLLGATVMVGNIVRSRLSEAESVLQPFMEPEAIDFIDGGEGLPAATCGGPAEIVTPIRAFHEAVDTDRARAIDEGGTPVEISTTDPTFDSFLLASAIARVSSGPHQLLLRARPGDGDWCVDEIVFSTEE